MTISSLDWCIKSSRTKRCRAVPRHAPKPNQKRKPHKVEFAQVNGSKFECRSFNID